MSGLFWLVRKDLRRFVADRNGALMTLVMPIVLGALLGTIFAPRETSPVDVLVVDLDGSPASARFVERVVASKALDAKKASPEEATKAVESGKIAVALWIPKGARISVSGLGGEGAGPELACDPSRQAECSLAGGVLQGLLYESLAASMDDPSERAVMTSGLEAALVLAGAKDSGVAAKTAVSLFDQAVTGDDKGGGGASSLAIKTRAVTATAAPGGYDSYAHNFAGMLCMFLLFFGIEHAKERIAERELGLDARLRLTPMTPRQLRLAEGLSAWLLAMAICVIVYTVAIVLFGVRVRGSWLGLGLVVAAEAFFVAGFALLLRAVAKTGRQAGSVGAFVSLIASFLGGAWLPSFLLPGWIQAFSHALPTYWATQGLAAMTWRGLGLEAALLPALALVGIGAICGGIGLARGAR